MNDRSSVGRFDPFSKDSIKAPLSARVSVGLRLNIWVWILLLSCGTSRCGRPPHITVFDIKYFGFSYDLESEPLVKSDIFV